MTIVQFSQLIRFKYQGLIQGYDQEGHGCSLWAKLSQGKSKVPSILGQILGVTTPPPSHTPTHPPCTSGRCACALKVPPILPWPPPLKILYWPLNIAYVTLKIFPSSLPIYGVLDNKASLASLDVSGQRFWATLRINQRF